MKNQKTHFPAVWNTRDEFITPFSQIFDNLIEQHFPEYKQDFGINFNKGAYPKVDIIDRSNAIQINAEIAGWDKEDITIELEGNLLTISGKNEGESNSQPIGEFTYIVKEIKRSSFSRSFRLDKNLNTSNLTATFDNGTLIITIAKKDEDKINPKQIIKIQ